MWIKGDAAVLCIRRWRESSLYHYFFQWICACINRRESRKLFLKRGKKKVFWGFSMRKSKSRLACIIQSQWRKYSWVHTSVVVLRRHAECLLHWMWQWKFQTHLDLKMVKTIKTTTAQSRQSQTCLGGLERRASKQTICTLAAGTRSRQFFGKASNEVSQGCFMAFWIFYIPISGMDKASISRTMRWDAWTWNIESWNLHRQTFFFLFSCFHWRNKVFLFAWLVCFYYLCISDAASCCWIKWKVKIFAD